MNFLNNFPSHFALLLTQIKTLHSPVIHLFIQRKKDLNVMKLRFKFFLTYFMQMYHFHTPRSTQENLWFLIFIMLDNVWIIKRLALTEQHYKRGEAFYSLLVTFYSLLVTFYSLLVTFYSLLVTFYSLLIAFYWLLVTFYSLLVATYLLLIVTHSVLITFYSYTIALHSQCSY